MKNSQLKNFKISNIIISSFLILLPFVAILLSAWYLGFFTDNDFVDICIKTTDEKGCTEIQGCDWKKDAKRCVMTASCTDIRSQQNCAEGCTWDPQVRRYDSNIYGLCRPDFRLSVDEVGEETELKQ
jgi:hypothetical protein